MTLCRLQSKSNYWQSLVLDIYLQNHETFCIYEKKVETVKVYNLTNINRTNNHLSLQLIKAKKKYMCVSDRPTAPKILPPTLTFFMPKKKKKIGKIQKFVSVSVFVSDFNNFLHFLVHLIDVWNQKTLYCMSNN
jgi:hypothetical protein